MKSQKTWFRREAPGRNRRQFVVADGGSGLEESQQSKGEAGLQRKPVFSKSSGLEPELEETAAESAVELVYVDLGGVEVDGVEQPHERAVQELLGEHRLEKASGPSHRTGLPKAIASYGKASTYTLTFKFTSSLDLDLTNHCMIRGQFLGVG